MVQDKHGNLENREKVELYRQSFEDENHSVAAMDTDFISQIQKNVFSLEIPGKDRTYFLNLVVDPELAEISKLNSKSINQTVGRQTIGLASLQVFKRKATRAAWWYRIANNFAEQQQQMVGREAVLSESRPLLCTVSKVSFEDEASPQQIKQAVRSHTLHVSRIDDSLSNDEMLELKNLLQ